MIEEYSNLGFPFTSKEVRDIAFEYASDHDLKGFTEDGCTAGYHWFKYFMERNPKLSIKTPINLSIARAMSSNAVILNHWFDEYEEVIKQLKIDDPKYLWNVDEHGTEDVLKRNKVVGIKCVKTFQTVSCEKSRRSTMLTYVNAAGYALPPMVIHRGKYHDRWRTNVQKRVMVCSSKKGYINKNLFAEYGKIFLYHLFAEGQLDKPNLIVMDSHYAHTFNYVYMKMMYERDIKVMGLKPHTSHLIQPLDKNPFSAFKDAFNNSLCKYNRQMGAKFLKKEDFFSVFNVAWEKSMTKKNIVAGFRRSGLWPPNRHVIMPEQLGPSAVSDKCEFINGYDYMLYYLLLFIVFVIGLVRMIHVCDSVLCVT